MWDKYENISDELLAAFLDGNVTKEETETVLEAMQFDEIREIIQISSSSWEESISMNDGDFDFGEMEIAPVLYDNDAVIASIVLNYNESIDDISNSNLFQSSDNNENTDTESNDNFINNL